MDIRTAILLVRHKDNTIEVLGTGGDPDGHDLLSLQRTMGKYVDEIFDGTHEIT